MPQLEEIMASGVSWLAATNIAKIPVGAGVGVMNDQGNIFVAAGAAVSPASTGSDLVMATFTIPALSFDIFGRTAVFEAFGTRAAGTNTTAAKIIINCTTAVVGSAVSGGTTIATCTATAAGSAGGWSMGAQLTKYGVAGSNTQNAVHFAGQSGSVALTLTAPQFLTLTESAALLCALTINCTTTATDLSWCTFILNWQN